MFETVIFQKEENCCKIVELLKYKIRMNMVTLCLTIAILSFFVSRAGGFWNFYGWFFQCQFSICMQSLPFELTFLPLHSIALESYLFLTPLWLKVSFKQPSRWKIMTLHFSHQSVSFQCQWLLSKKNIKWHKNRQIV